MKNTDTYLFSKVLDELRDLVTLSNTIYPQSYNDLLDDYGYGASIIKLQELVHRLYETQYDIDSDVPRDILLDIAIYSILTIIKSDLS